MLFCKTLSLSQWVGGGGDGGKTGEGGGGGKGMV